MFIYNVYIEVITKYMITDEIMHACDTEFIAFHIYNKGQKSSNV
jgi:hypothetical protein